MTVDTNLRGGEEGSGDASLRAGNSPGECETMDRNQPSHGQGTAMPACKEGQPACDTGMGTGSMRAGNENSQRAACKQQQPAHGTGMGTANARQGEQRQLAWDTAMGTDRMRYASRVSRHANIAS